MSTKKKLAELFRFFHKSKVEELPEKTKRITQNDYVRFEKTTADIYEVAWYLQNGAEILSSENVRVGSPKKEKKIGRSVIKRYRVGNVLKRSYQQWKDHTAVGNIRDYADIRASLKRRYLKGTI